MLQKLAIMFQKGIFRLNIYLACHFLNLIQPHFPSPVPWHVFQKQHNTAFSGKGDNKFSNL